MTSDRERLASTLRLVEAALRDLSAGNGTHWKEAVGELHSQTNDIPIWILLTEDVDLAEIHAAVCRTLQPHMAGLAPLEIVLFYERAVGDETFGATLSGNDAVFRAGMEGPIELRWYPRSNGLSRVFHSRDARRAAEDGPEEPGPRR